MSHSARTSILTERLRLCAPAPAPAESEAALNYYERNRPHLARWDRMRPDMSSRHCNPSFEGVPDA